MKLTIEKITIFYNKNRRMPSYSEIMKITGYKSKSAVSYIVNKLIDRGILSKDNKGKLILNNLSEIKVLGLVEAGFPSPAEEELADTISFDEYLIENKDASYILKIKGDSMKDAGINEGDMVVVERGANYRDGDIVIAEVDGQWTIKYFRQRKGKVYLEPANENYDSIYPTEELTVSAVVKAVVRKY